MDTMARALEIITRYMDRAPVNCAERREYLRALKVYQKGLREDI